MKFPKKKPEADASTSTSSKERDRKGDRKKTIRVFLMVFLTVVAYAWAIVGVVRLWRAHNLLVAGDAAAEATIAVLRENLDVPLDARDESDVQTDERSETSSDDRR